jgi:hypothetical protein
MKIDEFYNTPHVNELSGADAGKAVRSAGTGIKNFAKGFAQGVGGKTSSQLDDIKKQIAKLTPAERKELITHITALNKAPAKTAPTQTTPAATQTAPTQQAQAQATPAADAPAKTGSGITTALKKGAAAVGNAIKKGAASLTKPAAQQTPAAAPVEPTAANNKNAAAGDTYEKAKGEIRAVQGGTKPIPPNAAADIQGAIAKLAKGDKESGVFAAQKIMNLARAGVDVSKQQQAWVANSKAGERFLTQSQYFEITKMLREHKLSWSDLGMRVHLLEGTNKLIGISFI